MKSFSEKVVEGRRLVLLQLLSEQNGQMANSSVLQAGLHHLGVVCERHEVISDLRYLQDHNLVTMEQVVDAVYVAHLLGRGADLLDGLVIIDGIGRPRRGM